MARRISDDFEEDLDDAGGVALLVDNRQLPLAIAISHACEKVRSQNFRPPRPPLLCCDTNKNPPPPIPASLDHTSTY